MHCNTYTRKIYTTIDSTRVIRMMAVHARVPVLCVTESIWKTARQKMDTSVAKRENYLTWTCISRSVWPLSAF